MFGRNKFFHCVCVVVRRWEPQEEARIWKDRICQNDQGRHVASLNMDVMEREGLRWWLKSLLFPTGTCGGWKSASLLVVGIWNDRILQTDLQANPRTWSLFVSMWWL